jgi:hypothetical protein
MFKKISLLVSLLFAFALPQNTNVPGALTVGGKSLFKDTTRHVNGLKFGTAGDVNLYRASGTILATDDSLKVGGLAGSGTRLLAARPNGLFIDTALPIPGFQFGNPTGTIGLTAVNGTDTVAMRADGHPALSQSIVPTWTAKHTFTDSIVGANVRLTGTLNVAGQSTLTGATLAGGNSGQGNIYTTGTIGLALQGKTGSQYDLSLLATGGAGSYILRVPTGTTTAEIPNNEIVGGTLAVTGKVTGSDTVAALLGLRVGNTALSNVTWNRAGSDMWTTPDSVTIGGLGSAGNRIVAARSDGRLFDTLLTGGGGGVTFGNPTALIGLTAVNGTDTIAMRHDGAPALSQAITPTWTAKHTFTDSLVGANVRLTGTLNVAQAGTFQSTLNVTGVIKGNSDIDIDKAAGSTRDLIWQSASVNRWIARALNDAEPGSDSGSSWVLSARHDNGTAIDNVISIARPAHGTLTMNRPVTMSTTLLVDSLATFSGNSLHALNDTAFFGATSGKGYLTYRPTGDTLLLVNSFPGGEEAGVLLLSTSQEYLSLDENGNMIANLPGSLGFSPLSDNFTPLGASTRRWQGLYTGFIDANGKMGTSDTLYGEKGVRVGAPGTAVSNVVWVRSAANMWDTPDSVTVDGRLSVGGRISNSDSIVNGGNFRTDGDITLTASSTQIKSNTADGSDSHRLFITAGGGTSTTRGALIDLKGNEASGGGDISLQAGNSGGSTVSIGIAGSGAIIVDTITSGGGSGGRVLIDATYRFHHGPTVKTPSALSISSSLIAVDADLADFYTVTMTGNATLSNPTNARTGRHFTIRIKQDGTGSRTLAYGTAYRFPGGTAPTLSTAASHTDYESFFYDEVDATWQYVGNAFNFAP